MKKDFLTQNESSQENKGISEIVFILDKSGSMEGMEKDTIGGFNSMIKKQKELDGDVYITTVLFSNNLEFLHDRKKLEEIKPLTEKDYQVDGCTALFDAVGETIKHINNIHKYVREEDVPTRTMFIITTDGMENASKQYSRNQINDMIRNQREKGWEFLFLAANIDAVETADSIGIRNDHAINYVVEENTKEMYEELSDTICSFRCSAPINFEDIENNIKKRKKANKK